MISVVIPVRESKETIRKTIDSLYSQTLLPDEVIVVSTYNDSTYVVIKDYVEKGLVKIVNTNVPKEYIRDSQWKRYIGIKESKGDVVFLVDSKIILREDAIENSVYLMNINNVKVVAGITPAWPEQKKDFWAQVHDQALISNLPKFIGEKQLNSINFGKSESLPVTAMLMMKKEVFDQISEDFALNFSKIASTYDDYVLSWLIVRAGYSILTTNKVVAYHKHRISGKRYFQQIARSGQSAAIMNIMYHDCPFALRREKQVLLISIMVVVAISLIILDFFSTQLLLNFISWIYIIAFYSILGIINMVKSKNLKAYIFPFISILLILNFSYHFIKTNLKTNHNPKDVDSYLQIN